MFGGQPVTRYEDVPMRVAMQPARWAAACPLQNSENQSKDAWLTAAKSSGSFMTPHVGDRNICAALPLFPIV